MICSNCNFKNNPGAKFCQECGNTLSQNCAQCDHPVRPDAKFCENCGNKLSPSQQDSSKPQSRLLSQKSKAERRQLTVLFCDMKDSTALSEKLDPELFRELILSYHNIAEKVVRRYHGHVAQYLGDGLMVYFGYPKGLEDAPRVAVRAALGILSAMRHANQQLSLPENITVSIRIGVHTGLVVVDDHLALGETTNVAARLESLAPENSLVVSSETAKLISGWFDIMSMGALDIKGLSQPMEVFEVLRENTVRNRIELLKGKSLTPLIGREEETTLLTKSWQKARDGVGQIMVLNGEAGIGKSRLVDFMKDQFIKDESSWIAEINCSPYHQNTPLFPITEFLENTVLQFTPDEDPVQRLSKLEAFALQAGMDSSESLFLLSELLTIPLPVSYQAVEVNPSLRKRKTYELLIQGLCKRSTEQNVVIIVEDLHWSDDSTLEWLDLLVEQISSFPIFVLATSRPGYKAKWSGRTNSSQLSLSKIPSGRTGDICLHISGGKKLPDSVIQLIQNKTDGVPLFIEELTRMLIDSSILIEKEDYYDIKGNLQDIIIPSTIQDLLTSRLDRLGSLKDLIQKAAVIGREFSLEILNKLVDISEDQLYRNLSELVKDELLYQKGVGSQTIYIMKHALIRDTAYESLLLSRRQELHSQIADVMLGDVYSGSDAEKLAYHLEEARRPQEAVHQWFMAGLLSLKRFASTEALAHFDKTRLLLESLTKSKENILFRINCLMQLVTARILHSGFVHTDVNRYSLECLELSDYHTSPAQTSAILHFLGWHHNFSGRYEQALEYHKQNMALVESQSASFLISDAEINIGCTKYLMGRFKEAQHHLDKVLSSINYGDPSIFEDYGYGSPKIVATNHYVYVLMARGQIAKAKEHLDIGLEEINSTDNPWAVCLIRVVDVIYKLRQLKDYEGALQSALIVYNLGTENGNAFWIGYGSFLIQIAKAMLGDEDAVNVASFVFAALKEANAISYRISTGCDLAEACWALNKYELIEPILEELLEHHKNTKEAYYLPEVYRLRARLHRQNNDHSQADQALRTAIKIANEQDGSWFELLSRKDLAGLKLESGEFEDGLRILEPMLGFLHEPLILPDLQELKSLYEKLMQAKKQ